jgi:predicted secreted hydrolase
MKPVRLLALAAVTIFLCATSVPAARFDIAKAPYTFVFPHDHAAHFGYASEWWYYTGHVHAKDGRKFGFELTFFRYGLRPGDARAKAGQSAWRGSQVYLAHFAITDESAGRFVYYERFAREALGAGGASERTLDVHADDWSLRGTAPFRLSARSGSDGLTFALSPQKAPAIHGHDGVSRKGACASCASHYYSITRLRAHGTLAYGGERLPIDGIAWMDHEFGSGELAPSQAGWDWFSIQLDDGRELMLYHLRQKDGSTTPQSSGSLIARDGRVTYVPLSGFTTTATGSWKSPHTGATYPSGWRVTVPAANIDVTLVPTVLDQELANTTGGISYWEGSVHARDTASGHDLGAGYVELTGYAGGLGKL